MPSWGDYVIAQAFSCPCHETAMEVIALLMVHAGRGASLAPRRVASEGIIYSARVKSLADLRDDDDAAAEEAQAQGGECLYEEPWHTLCNAELEDR